MRKANMIWGVLILVLVLLAYILPYTLMTNVQAWYGSFLVWGVIALCIIVINIIITRDWGK